MSFQPAPTAQGEAVSYGRDGHGLQRALHGGLGALGVMLLSLCGAIVVTESAPIVGVLLGAPALVYAVFSLANMAEMATTRVDPSAAPPLTRLARELGAPERLRVLVWDKGCGVTLRKQGSEPELRSQPAFVRTKSTQELRGAIAVRLCEQESDLLARSRRRKDAAIVAVVFVTMTAAAAVAPRLPLLVAFAPMGLLAYVFVVAGALASHRTSRQLCLYAPVDRAAAARTGDAACVQAGLRALDAAEREGVARAGRLGRLLLRMASPVWPNPHFAARADQLGAPLLATG